MFLKSICCSSSSSRRYHPSFSLILSSLIPIILRSHSFSHHSFLSSFVLTHSLITHSYHPSIFSSIHGFLSSDFILRTIIIDPYLTNLLIHPFLYTIYCLSYGFIRIIDNYTQHFPKSPKIALFPPKVIGSSPQLTKMDIRVPTDTL
jgi:hypothetical protein